jgi:tRNA A37 threonylcarbamoyladenosine modification protein TsaB
MYLVIDCTKKEQIQLSLYCSATDTRTYVHEGRQVDLLVAIHAFLAQQGFRVDQILGICAVTGEGSFTSSRLAVLCANVFHFVLGTAVVAIDTETEYSFESIRALCQVSSGAYALATYSGLPNIRS